MKATSSKLLTHGCIYYCNFVLLFFLARHIVSSINSSQVLCHYLENDNSETPVSRSYVVKSVTSFLKQREQMLAG